MFNSIAFNLFIIVLSAINIVYSVYLAVQLYLGHPASALEIQIVFVLTAICLSYSFLCKKN